MQEGSAVAPRGPPPPSGAAATATGSHWRYGRGALERGWARATTLPGGSGAARDSLEPRGGFSVPRAPTHPGRPSHGTITAHPRAPARGGRGVAGRRASAPRTAACRTAARGPTDPPLVLAAWEDMPLVRVRAPHAGEPSGGQGGVPEDQRSHVRGASWHGVAGVSVTPLPPLRSSLSVRELARPSRREQKPLPPAARGRYQICGTRSRGRTMGSPWWQPNACANAGMLDKGPFTRQRSGAWGSTVTRVRSDAARVCTRQLCA